MTSVRFQFTFNRNTWSKSVLCTVILGISVSCEAAKEAAVFTDATSDSFAEAKPKDAWMDVSLTDGTADVRDTQADVVSDGAMVLCPKRANDDCDLIAQDCAPGKMCSFVLDKSRSMCVEMSLGLSNTGAACSNSNDCRAGLFCVLGRCSPACCPASTNGCLGGVCEVAVTDPKSQQVIFHACNFAQNCTPFNFACNPSEVCTFAGTGTFKCTAPLPPSTMAQAPGADCKASAQCGESQGCLTILSTASDAGTPARCTLFCKLPKGDAGAVEPLDAACADGQTGFPPPSEQTGGRFPADGTCGCYGKCTRVSGLGLPDELGVCAP